jgi:hypothetical protein
MDNELEIIWKEAVYGLIEVLFQHVPGGTEENHEKHQLGQTRFEPKTSRI